jgi:dipeptidyl aminopeptidase/acylaminoacyl peptidase
VEGTVVSFESFDGVRVPGILYIPHQASRAAKVPALIWVHGGHSGYSGVGYNALFQYLANQGYAIYAINNRGGWGFGKTFHSLVEYVSAEEDERTN